MRIILEIPDEEVEIIKRNGFNKDGTFSFKLNEVVKQAIRNGVVLPDNATNGDVMKMLFGCGELSCDCDTDYESVIAYGLDTTPTCKGTLFTSDWWKAPYKGGTT